MEISVSTNSVDLTRAVSDKPSPAPPRRAVDSTVFTNADRLDQSLGATSDVRPDAVARAQGLIGDVAYPPTFVLRGIAALLAMHLDNNESS